MPFDLTVLHVGILGCAALVFILAGISDARRYKIPNRYVLILMLLYPVYALSSPLTVDWMMGVAVFAGLLLLGFLMFQINIIGAGDVKLMAAAGLWSGTSLLALFLLMTALSGAVVCLFVMWGAWKKNAMKPKEDRWTSMAFQKIQVPYGLAIAVGGLSMLLHHFQALLHA